MSEIEEAVKLFGREDLLGEYGIQDTDTNIEVFLSVKDMIKYYKQDKEIERLNNIINELEEYIVRKLKEFNSPEEYYTLKQIDKINYRLQELKGSDKK